MSTMAKCGIYKYSFCTHKHNASECSTCILVKRRPNLYKRVGIHKLKQCPKCGKYKALDEFKTNSQGNKSWCYECQKAYAREYARKKKLEEKPIVRITFISPDNIMHKQQHLNVSQFKQFCKEFIESETFGTKVIITKL